MIACGFTTQTEMQRFWELENLLKGTIQKWGWFLLEVGSKMLEEGQEEEEDEEGENTKDGWVLV